MESPCECGIEPSGSISHEVSYNYNIPGGPLRFNVIMLLMKGYEVTVGVDHRTMTHMIVILSLLCGGMLSCSICNVIQTGSGLL